jgi:sugar lactone lactonase YvrE
MTPESINNPICQLAECPLWNAKEKALCWTDIVGRSVWHYEPASGEITSVWQGQYMVGGLAFNTDGTLILCTEGGVFKVGRDPGDQMQLLYDIPMAGDERFNDITTDPRGRLYAGTLTDRRTEGLLYRLEKGKEPAVVMRDIRTSNGMTFSLDHRYFYHTDSRARTITRYKYDPVTGDIENPMVVYQANEADGVPDGITMDAEGFIWVACFSGAKVLRIDDQGKVEREVPVPAYHVTSVMFGGDNLNELFITTACEHAADPQQGLDEQGRYLGGHVYRVVTDVKGREEWYADL